MNLSFRLLPSTYFTKEATVHFISEMETGVNLRVSIKEVDQQRGDLKRRPSHWSVAPMTTSLPPGVKKEPQLAASIMSTAIQWENPKYDAREV